MAVWSWNDMWWFRFLFFYQVGINPKDYRKCPLRPFSGIRPTSWFIVFDSQGMCSVGGAVAGGYIQDTRPFFPAKHSRKAVLERTFSASNSSIVNTLVEAQGLAPSGR